MLAKKFKLKGIVIPYFKNGNHYHKFNFTIFTSRNQGEVSREPQLVLSSFLSDTLERVCSVANVILNHTFCLWLRLPQESLSMCGQPSQFIICLSGNSSVHS